MKPHQLRYGIFLAALFFAVPNFVSAQQWFNMASMTGTRAWPLGFAIGDYGYCGQGGSYTSTNDLWQYDPMANTWTQVATPPTTRSGAFTFVLDSFAYVGLGNSSTDCWKYNGFTNQWYPIDSFPSAPRNCPAYFQIGNYGYVGTGSMSRDFWCYDILNDIWTPIDSFPGAGRTQATGFAINGNGYVGLGGDGNGWSALTDFWKYDTAVGWIALSPFPGTAREGSVAVTLLGNGYLCGGGGYMWSFSNELWVYDPTFDYWMPSSPLPAGGRKGMAAFVVDSTAFFGTGTAYGFDPPMYFYNDWYKFSFSILMDAGNEIEAPIEVFALGHERIIVNNRGEYDGATVQVFTIAGQLTMTANMSGSHCEVDVACQPPGLYLVVVQSSQKVFSQKVMLR